MTLWVKNKSVCEQMCFFLAVHIPCIQNRSIYIIDRYNLSISIQTTVSQVFDLYINLYLTLTLYIVFIVSISLTFIVIKQGSIFAIETQCNNEYLHLMQTSYTGNWTLEFNDFSLFVWYHLPCLQFFLTTLIANII